MLHRNADRSEKNSRRDAANVLSIGIDLRSALCGKIGNPFDNHQRRNRVGREPAGRKSVFEAIDNPRVKPDLRCETLHKRNIWQAYKKGHLAFGSNVVVKWLFSVPVGDLWHNLMGCEYHEHVCGERGVKEAKSGLPGNYTRLSGFMSDTRFMGLFNIFIRKRDDGKTQWDPILLEQMFGFGVGRCGLRTRSKRVAKRTVNGLQEKLARVE